MTPKSYTCRFIQPGIISYNDQHEGTILVDKTALDNMAKTFRNCPVIFIPEQHDDSNKENSFNFSDLSKNPASGIITGIPYWKDDGWMWVEFTVWDEATIKAIKKGYSVSCAYIVDKVGDSGIWHQIPYDEQVLDGHYIHMAIVARPRYEGSQIFANSKGGHGVMALFGITKKDKEPIEPEAKQEKQPEIKKDDEKVLNAETTNIDIDGEKVPLSKLIESYQKENESDSENPSNDLNDDDEIVLQNGDEVTIADLKSAYSKKNKDNPESKSDSEPKDSSEPKDDSNKDKVMTNSLPEKKVNQALHNAAKTNENIDNSSIETLEERLERGRRLYSTPAENGGK